MQKYSFCRGETNSPTLDHCLPQKGRESGSGAASNPAPRAKSSEVGTEQGGTDLIFNSISKKGVQGVTGGVDTSGISDKKSRGERKAKSRQLGCSPGQEEEEREASLLGLDRTQALPPAAPRARGGRKTARHCPGDSGGDILSLSQAEEQVIFSRIRVALGKR